MKETLMILRGEVKGELRQENKEGENQLNMEERGENWKEFGERRKEKVLPEQKKPRDGRKVKDEKKVNRSEESDKYVIT